MTLLSSPSSSEVVDILLPSRLVDVIFVSLMENGYNENTKSNKYIVQFVHKFRFFRIKSPETSFEISYKDLNIEALNYIKDYTKDCKTTEEKYQKLDGVITEVIARITKQAEPIILSSITSEGILWTKTSLNQIREVVSQKWALIVEGNENDERIN